MLITVMLFQQRYQPKGLATFTKVKNTECGYKQYE